MSLIQRVPWTVQPQGAARLDPVYGITHLLNGNTFIDLVANGQFVNTNGAVPSVGQIGTGPRFAKASSQRLRETLSVPTPSKYSFIAVIDSTGTDTNYSNVFNVFKTGGYAFQLRHTSGSWNYYHFATIDNLAAGTYAAGKSVLIGTYDGANMRLYVNGVLTATTAAGALAASTVSEINVGSDLIATNTPVALTYFDGQIALAGFAFGTAWGNTTSLSLSANPWQLFAPLPRRLFAPPAASSFLTLSAATYKPGTLTSTGFQPRVTST